MSVCPKHCLRPMNTPEKTAEDPRKCDTICNQSVPSSHHPDSLPSICILVPVRPLLNIPLTMRHLTRSDLYFQLLRLLQK